MAFLKRLVRLLWGLFLYAAGTYCTLRSGVGLAPWDAFAMGVSLCTGIRFGSAVVWIGAGILVLDVLAREKIGLGTLLNVVLIGKFTDLLLWVDPLPWMQGFWSGLGMMLLGQVIICAGSYYYMSCAWGCGPRDALMVAVNRRLPRVPIGAARFLVEGAALLIGWLLGAPVGVGTAMSMFGISFLLQAVFALFHFDAKAVRHESLRETVLRLCPGSRS